MNNAFDPITLIFLALAVFVFFRLRSVLGKRTGNERPPTDPFSRRDAPPPGVGQQGAPMGDKVVPLPQRNGNAAPGPMAPPPPPADRWKGVAEPGTPLAAHLDQIAADDPTFESAYFVGGAKAAYEMIVGAFAAGDRKALKPLLSKEVFDSFAAEITERERRGEIVETRFVSIDKADIIDAAVKNGAAQVTVKFVSKMLRSVRDRSGEVIDGSADKVIEIVDIWTFARELRSRDPNWRLVATEEAQ